ncbi:MAG: GTP 3',8-cyclase MoaA [Acidobacteria bacterium]|nr:GTP 3',8-cyclase MoaA [Acidobacteriota bacterium]
MPLDALQRPLRSLRLSVTDRCNFRCTYCMPAERFPPDYPFLPREDILHFEELARLAVLFTRLGVEKIRLTGGEPLLRKDLPALVKMLRATEGIREITLTTNGALLAGHAKALKEAGLARVTVSLDTLDPARFQAVSDTSVPLALVLEGIAEAQGVGLHPVKINCVVQAGVNDDEVLDLAGWARGRGLALRFIEFMDVGSAAGWRLDRVLSGESLRARIHARWPLDPVPQDRLGQVAFRHRYRDGAGEVGFISSVTEPFCLGCDRARLSADGHLYTCLFAGEGLDLKGLLRGGAGDATLEAAIAGRWARREDRYSLLRTEATAALPKVPMHRVGG